MRLLPALCLLAGLLAPPASAQYTATRVASGLLLPLLATAPTDDPADDRLFIAGQNGQIQVLEDGVVLPTPFLDLDAEGLISKGGEKGLLGLAFAPDYAESGTFYVNYTDPDGDTVVARYQVGDDPNVADPESAEVLFSVVQPAGNHNGGHMAFSPVDGFLYIAMGDGGTRAPAQDFSDPLGALLRIDVSEAPGFEVPASNPGFDEPRIWSGGLRNPFRFSFDRVTGDLFIGDVGAQRREEVNFQPASSDGGLNYEWDVCEGTFCGGGAISPGVATGPVMEYAHGEFPDVLSVIGGYRYRGPVLSLHGIYFFGDLGGLLFAARETAPGAFDFEPITVIPDAGSIDAISSFGEDAAGNVYIVDIADGEVFRLEGALGCPETPRPDCRMAERSKVAMKGAGGPKDRLKWKWRGGATETADFGDPLANATLLLCVYSGDPATLAMQALVPPGADWKPTGDKGFKHKGAGTSGGIDKVKLRSGDAGKAGLAVSGRGAGLDLPELPLGEGGPVVFQLENDETGACWEDVYAGDDVSRNDAGRFRAKTK